ncbi:hypothetical protein Tco_0604919, partial [Tanacetum coccineum]
TQSNCKCLQQSKCLLQLQMQLLAAKKMLQMQLLAGKQMLVADAAANACRCSCKCCKCLQMLADASI